MPRDAHSAAKAVDMLDLLIEFFDGTAHRRLLPGHVNVQLGVRGARACPLIEGLRYSNLWDAGI